MYKHYKLSGVKFGRLTVVKKVNSESTSKHSSWLCECECGNEKVIAGNSLVFGVTRSCGCLASELSVKRVEGIKEEFIQGGTDISQLDRTLNKNNTSGVKGVTWDKNTQKWVASIMFKRKNIYLGRFKNKEDAIKARLEGEKKYFQPVLEKYNKEKQTKK